MNQRNLVDRDTEWQNAMLHALKRQVDFVLGAVPITKTTTAQERSEFHRVHRGAHFVLGDFEIQCLNPQKYKRQCQ